MKKQILNIGKVLTKTEQKTINGGLFGGQVSCASDRECDDFYSNTAIEFYNYSCVNNECKVQY